MVLSALRHRRSARVWPWLLCVVGLTVGDTRVPHAQPSAVLFGRVDVKLPRRDVRPDIHESGVGRRPATDRRRSVVYFETAPRNAFEGASERRARIDQRDETFVPHILAVTAGTIVDFPNSDPTYHNVFSLSRSKQFDLGRYAAGRTKSVVFDRPGIVRVFCDIHSHMNAWILVFAHRYFAVTDEAGRYRIEGIPPGTYTVSVWNEAVARESQVVTLGPSPVELDFTLSRERAPR
ncbi:MAG: carboxypeptidase regulatory-like domain-containing protein [Vicinamibacterales bacterium]